MAGPVPLELPGPYDTASAQVLKKIGFQALWAGGNVSSAGRLGVPDVNLMTMTEQLEFCTSIVDATGLPVVADTDDGYGQALMVTRTVQAFERAGLAAIVIEDQASPKHCAFYEGLPLELISREQHVAKIKAAVDARTDETMMIWARTDALPGLHSTAAALDRAHACVEAGADAVFTPSSSLDDLAKIGHAWDRPGAPRHEQLQLRGPRASRRSRRSATRCGSTRCPRSWPPCGPSRTSTRSSTTPARSARRRRRACP